MGELKSYGLPYVFELDVGRVVDKDGDPIYRDEVKASDMIVVEINYRTGLAWLEPARR